MAKKPKQPASELQEALKFCKVAARDIGQPYQSHLLFGKGWLCAFDGVIAAAHPVKASDTLCCPNADMFRTAIARAQSDLAMTIAPDNDRISIVTGKLRANVPCIDISTFPFYAPDKIVGNIDNRLRASIIACGALVSESATRLHEASMLMRANSCISTDAKILIESWHGCNVPTLILPKAIAVALEKTQDKNLVSFGYSDHTITFYFEDGAWIKSQLYDGAVRDYPDVDAVLRKMFAPELLPVPSDLFEGIETLIKFADENCIVFDKDKIETKSGEASYLIDLSSIPLANDALANPKFFEMAKWATHWNITKYDNGVCFSFTGTIHAEPARALVMGSQKREKSAQELEDEKVPF